MCGRGPFPRTWLQQQGCACGQCLGCLAVVKPLHTTMILSLNERAMFEVSVEQVLFIGINVCWRCKRFLRSLM